MTDTTAPAPEHHPFDPAVRTRLRAFLDAVPKHAITIAIRPGASLRRPDLAQLLERDEWSDKTRLELAESCAKLRSQRDELHAENERHRFAHASACQLVADMHAAAVGEVTGPNRGVVEDIADLRARCLAAEEALDIALHGGQRQAPEAPKAEPVEYETDAEPMPVHGEHGTCAKCGQAITYWESPHGAWWAHDAHPADGHDAEIGGPA